VFTNVSLGLRPWSPDGIRTEYGTLSGKADILESLELAKAVVVVLIKWRCEFAVD
jgi:hypothetical protein